MTAPVRIGLAGAGQVGARHAVAIAQATGVDLAAVADPSDAAAQVAAAHDVQAFETLEAMLGAGGLDAVLLATPTGLHASGGLACLAAGLAVLVEKPIAATVADARELVAAAEAAGLPLAVGHHRRHAPVIAQAKALIEDGAIGPIVAVHASTWLRKPEDYFDIVWRRQPGAGPVLTNLIHDVDLMLHLVGPVTEVQAMLSSHVRGLRDRGYRRRPARASPLARSAPSPCRTPPSPPGAGS